jgi:hypothetical protein
MSWMLRERTSTDGLALLATVHTFVVDTGQAGGLALLGTLAALPRKITARLGAHAIDIGVR